MSGDSYLAFYHFSSHTLTKTFRHFTKKKTIQRFNYDVILYRFILRDGYTYVLGTIALFEFSKKPLNTKYELVTSIVRCNRTRRIRRVRFRLTILTNSFQRCNYQYNVFKIFRY